MKPDVVANRRTTDPSRMLRTSRLASYAKLAFSLPIVFGIVGNFMGHRTMSMTIFMVTALCWALGKILYEAYQAYQTITNDRQDPPDEPPTAVVTA